MRDERSPDTGDSVGPMQANLDRGTPQILASYGLIGAILLLGAIGFLADRYLGTSPWCLLGGLAVGVVVGFYQLSRVLKR